ncbi:MAG: hypothetical protein QM535_13895 [Limnohabitans sp.]|nr:hypothetical protein [Limnohabitans sp.]
MKKIFILITLIVTYLTHAQVGMGTNTPNADSDLELGSNNKALLVNRVANTASVVNPTDGMIIYDISTNCFKGYANGLWTDCFAIVPNPTIQSFNCVSGITTGTLTINQVATGVSISVPYTNGNGFTYPGMTVSSTGVLGLTATLTTGALVDGNGVINFTVTGTPTTAGTATFTINFLGNTCVITIPVYGTIASLNCAGATHSGTLVGGQAASGVSTTIPYTGGTGGPYSGVSVASTGVTGLTATLTAGNFNVGAGTLIFNITGTPSPITGGTASFTVTIGGQTCTFTRTVNAPPPLCNVSGQSVNLTGFGAFPLGIGTVTATAVNGTYLFPFTQTACSVSVATGPFYSTPTSDGDLRLTFSNPFTGRIVIVANAMGGEQLCVTNETTGLPAPPASLTNVCRTYISGNCVQCTYLAVPDATGNTGSGHGTMSFNITNSVSVLLDFSPFSGSSQNGTIYSVQVICN